MEGTVLAKNALSILNGILIVWKFMGWRKKIIRTRCTLKEINPIQLF